MRRYFLVITLFFFASVLSAQYFDMIPAGDPLLDDIRFLSLEAGITFLSFTPPLAPSELKNFLDLINEDDLSYPAKESYSRILSRFSSGPNLVYSAGFFKASISAETNLEGRIRFNDDVSWYPDNKFDYKPLLAFQVQFFLFDSVQLFIEPAIKLKPEPDFDNRPLSNIPFNFETEYWPLRSFAAFGGSWWNFQIGRDHLFWGTGHTGSMSFSNDSVFYDFARLSLFSSVFKYSLIVNQIPLKLKENLFIDAPADWDAYENRISVNRYLYIHRIDANLFNCLSLGSMEGIIVNSPLELRYLNPFLIFHSIYAWNDYDVWQPGTGTNKDSSMTGSFFSFEINWNIIKPLAIYGQFAMNELTLLNEFKDGKTNPNAMGFLTGIHFSHSFNKWGSVYFVEFIYTQPYLYILSSPFSSFIHRDYYFYLIGHSRDTISLSAGAEFFNLNNTLSFKGSFSWIASGSHNKDGLKWDWKSDELAYNESTPTGTPEYKYILSFNTEWKPLTWLSVKAGVTGIFSVNNNYIKGNTETGGQASLAVGLHY